MRSIALSAFVLVLCLACISCAVATDSIWDLEAVSAIGLGTNPKVNADPEPANEVVVEGVALAGSTEILNPNGVTPWVHQYTGFIQQENTDRGGIQFWAGSWFYGSPLWYTCRTTDYVDFAAGDRLRVTGYLQDAGRGKVVINHRHSPDPDMMFKVEVIGHPGLPDPVLVPSVSDCNYFDQTRSGGGERYQTRYVMLHGVEKVSGTWGAGSSLSVQDATGSVGMLLSAMGDFGSYSEPSGKMNVVGIFDQEDTTAPHTSDYRVWVKRYSDIAEALSACREVRDRNEGARVALVNKVVTRVFGQYCYIEDQNRAGGVRVETSRGYEPGDLICVQGTVSVVDGEKVIVPTYLASGRATAAPVTVNSAALWGQSGLDVRGMLVRCSATMGSARGDGTYNLIDDGGQTIFLSPGLCTVPASGTPVIVTAIADSESGIPLLRCFKNGDVRSVN
jgi:hypothetical protein